jgi:hypothetical protein
MQTQGSNRPTRLSAILHRHRVRYLLSDKRFVATWQFTFLTEEWDSEEHDCGWYATTCLFILKAREVLIRWRTSSFIGHIFSFSSSLKKFINTNRSKTFSRRNYKHKTGPFFVLNRCVHARTHEQCCRGCSTWLWTPAKGKKLFLVFLFWLSPQTDWANT